MAFINYGGAKNKSMIISISRTLWAIPRPLAPIAAAIIVAHYGGINAEGVRPLFYIQLILSLLVFIGIAIWLKGPKVDSTEKATELVKKGSGFIQDFRDVFKGERYLKRYMTMQAIRTIGMNTATSFIPLWMVNVKGADPYILGLTTVAGMIVSVILQIPVGRLSDKIGRKKAYLLLRPFSWVAELLLIWAPSPEWFILVGFLGGNVSGGGEGIGIGGISFIPNITMQWEMVPEKKRGRWHGILQLFGILTFPASILGGILWQQGLMIAVLLLPIVTEVLVATPILLTIPETLGRTNSS